MIIENIFWFIFSMTGMLGLNLHLLISESFEESTHQQFSLKLQLILPSLLGAVILLFYSLHKNDYVFIVGTSIASLYYFGQLMRLFYHQLKKKKSAYKK